MLPNVRFDVHPGAGDDTLVDAHVEIVKMGESMQRYRMHCLAAGLSERTIASRELVVAAFLAGRDPKVITTDDVAAFLAAPGFSAGTRRTYFTHLFRYFAWCLDVGLVDQHPMATLGTPKTPPRVPRPVTTTQLAQILACSMWPSTRAQILLAAYAGLRVHEIAKIRGDDFATGRLIVAGKGGRVDAIPVPLVLQTVVERMPHSGWWFPSPVDPSRPVSRASVSTAIARVMHRAGVPGSAHALRHWYATTLLREGVDVRIVQSLMRHASLATTAGYLAITSTAQDSAVEQLPAVA